MSRATRTRTSCEERIESTTSSWATSSTISVMCEAADGDATSSVRAARSTVG